MKKGREIISLPIFCQETSSELGEVKDLIYDFTRNQTMALVVEPEGWIKAAKLIKFDEARLEQEQVVIENVSQLKNGKRDEDAKRLWQTRQSLFGTRILTASGEVVGIIADTLLDEKTGQIVGYELSESFVDDLLTGRKTLLLADMEAQNYHLEPLI